MKLWAGFFLIVSSIFGQAAQPTVSNARFETRAFSGDLSSQMQTVAPSWFGYAITTVRGDHRNCCWNDGQACGCALEGRSGGVIQSGNGSNTAVQLEGSDRVAVLFRVENNAIEKVQVYSLTCPLDAGGLPFVWITNVPPAASLAYLGSLVEADGPKHVTDGAIFAISQHEGAAAIDLLIRSAKRNASPHVRSQALFWLAQRAGERASAAITDAIVNDPDQEVKKRAVFALSQLPASEGVPKLIDVARTNRNREVRKQAFFWLGQSKDPRAFAFIEDVLTK